MEHDWSITETDFCNEQNVLDIHGTTSRSLLVKGQEVHIHVRCGRGFSCPSDCFVINSFVLTNFQLKQITYFIPINCQILTTLIL
jgi:hypothetical protein